MKQARGLLAQWLKRTGLVLVVLLGPGLSSLHANAPVLPSIDASKIANELKEPDRPISSLPAGPSAKTPSAVKVPVNAEKMKFVLQKTIVEGNKAYSSHTLEDFFKPFMHKETTLEEVYLTINKIDQKYKKDGYIFSHVFLPPQEITKGKVKIYIQEAYIAKVTYKDPIKLTDKMATIIQRIEKNYPFNIKKLERDLLLLNDLGGYTITSSLNPMKPVAGRSETPLELILEVSKKWQSGRLAYNNHGSSYTSPQVIFGQYQLNHVLGSHSKTSLSIMQSPKTALMQSVNFSYQTPLNTLGTAAGLSFNQTRARLQKELTDFGVRTRFVEAAVNLNHTLLRSRVKTWSIGSSLLTDKNSMYTFNQSLSNNHVDKLNIQTRYDFSDELQGTNLWVVNYIQLLNGYTRKNQIDANAPTNSGQVLNINSNKFTANLYRLQNLTQSFDMALTLNSQYSHFGLPSSERFAYGGQNIGRGYDLSEVNGDSGASALAELICHLKQKPTNRLDLFIFADVGQVWSHDSVDFPKMNGSSGGGGLRGSLHDFQYELLFARPFKQMQASDKKSFSGKFAVAYGF